MRPKHCLLLTSVLVLTFSAASAQAPPTPATPPEATLTPSPSRGSDCSSARSGSDGVPTGLSGQPLSDKLAKSDGVLCPPAGVDPEIRAPAPDAGKADAGRMPVIPPPGSPGGDPTVRPK